jgi:GTP-binding protein
MKIASAQFVRSATAPSHYPAARLPEIAFLGRSNVGKSSLINSLLNVRGLARTSNTPGRTQHINFFIINEAFYFVDLPGYGYARVPQAVRNEWGPMIEQYLTKRESLALGVLIVDVRHEPQRLDLQMREWMEATGRQYCVVATKSDKLSRPKLAAQAATLRAAYGPSVIPYSSLTRLGEQDVWRAIRSAMEDLKNRTRAPISVAPAPRRASRRTP